MISEVKKCPLCKLDKPLEDYDKYFSKARQKYRLQSRCKVCMPEDARKRANDYFLRNREKKLQYARDYRANPENRDKLRALKKRFKKKYSAELRESFIAGDLASKMNMTVVQVKQVPGLIEWKKDRIEIFRLMRRYNKEHR